MALDNFIRNFVFSVFLASQIIFYCYADFAAIFNISTFQTKSLTKPPFQLQFSLFDPVSVINNANGIDIYLTGRRNSLSGGPTESGAIYYAYNIRVNLNSSIFGVSGLTIDNVGTPVTVNSYFYNGKYGSPAQASLFSDGVFIVRQAVRIGAPNPYFPAFRSVINQIRNVGSQAQTSNVFAISWFHPIRYIGLYYSYTGLYASTLGDVPLRYGLATVAVLPLQYASTISPVQFWSFLQLFVREESLTPSSTEFLQQIDVPVYWVNGPVYYKITL